MTATIDDRTALRLRPLTFLPEGDGVVVGCAQVDSYAVLPPDGAALLERLTQVPPQEAARWYEATYGEPVDLDDFVDTLAELDFLDDDSLDVAEPERLRFQRLGQLFFSPLSGLFAGLLVWVAVACVVRDPGLVPHTDHVFFSDYLLVIELTVAFGQIPLILIHEVLPRARRPQARRRRPDRHQPPDVLRRLRDGDGRPGRRPPGEALPAHARRHAGRLPDRLRPDGRRRLASTPGGPPSLVAGVCLALAFSTLIRFALEFLLFLRTDVYYLICTLTGTVDLHTTSTEIVANRWWRLVGRKDRLRDPARWHPNDVRVARWYTPLHVLGYAFAILLLLVVLLPISWRFLVTALGQLAHPDLASGLFWDALGLLLLNVAQPPVRRLRCGSAAARRRQRRA